MKPIFDNLEEIKTKILKHRGFMLFCDFDGTLSKIVPDHDKAFIDPDIKSALESLTKDSKKHLVIISGRQLIDVKSRVGIIDSDYVGNHGLEWEVNGNYETYDLDENIYSSLEKSKYLFRDLSKDYPGVTIEDKKLSLSIHYRALLDVDQVKFKKSFYKILEGSSVVRYLNFVEGKKVIDVRPKIDWNKGRAAGMIRKKYNDQLTIAIGDDVTDEDLFKQFPEGISIKVGLSETSAADYFIMDTREVARFIHFLSSL